MKCIINGKIITPTHILENKAIVFDSTITDICDNDNIPENTEIIDAKGNYVCPGFISTHIHGCMNCDVSDGSAQSLEVISKHLLSTGVTAWCPTLCTVNSEDCEKALNAARTAKKSNIGAKIIGVYLEGIFLSKAKKGAHREDWLKSPDASVVTKNKDIISKPEQVFICLGQNLIIFVASDLSTILEALSYDNIIKLELDKKSQNILHIYK